MNNLYEEIKEKCCSRCDAECDGCWLEELITDRLKEERKRVVREIRNHINDRIQNESCFMTRDENGESINTMATICSNYTINELSFIIKYLDQIER